MKEGLFMLLLSISVGCFSQESYDIKSHEGSDGDTFGRSAARKNILFHDTKARSKDDRETKLANNLFAPSKETKARIDEMNEARKRAFEALKSNFEKSNGVLVQCKSCEGSGERICRDCKGDKYVECSVCHGAPTLECRECRGGRIGSDETCRTCNGSGKSECRFCQGKPIACATCVGVGGTTCSDCSGAGMSFKARVPIGILNDVDTIDRGSSIRSRSVSDLTAAQEDSILRATYKMNTEKSSKPKKKQN